MFRLTLIDSTCTEFLLSFDALEALIDEEVATGATSFIPGDTLEYAE